MMEYKADQCLEHKYTKAIGGKSSVSEVITTFKALESTKAGTATAPEPRKSKRNNARMPVAALKACMLMFSTRPLRDEFANKRRMDGLCVNYAADGRVQ